MVARLVLGCSTLGNAVVDAAGENVRVLESDENRVETLRNDGIDARTGDPGDRETVAGFEDVDVIFVGGDDPETNRRAVEAARDAHPEATVVAYHGRGATATQRRTVRETADVAFDAGTAVLGELDDVELADAERSRGLRSVLRDVEGTLGVVPHDNPDPDAIASAVALARLARAVGVSAEIAYYGEITHQENRALVNRLDFELRNLAADDQMDYDAVALVDHARPGVNDQLSPGLRPAVVIDHHPHTVPVDADFADVRVDAGSTSTLLVDYFEQFGLVPDPDVATGLLYGIRVDTRDFTRETTPADFEAAASLWPHVDREAVEDIESPSVSGDTLDTIARAVRNRQTRGAALVSCVGQISERDTLSQAADRLLTMEDIDTTLVCGFTDGTVYLSGRTRGTDVNLGDVLRDALGDLGSAGGHADMAGAQLSLGLFSEVEDEAETSLSTILTNVVTERFFAALAAAGAE